MTSETVFLKEGVVYDLGGKLMTLDEIRECVIDSDLFKKQFKELVEASE